MDIKILEDLLQLTIERRNLCNRHDQIIQKRIMVDLGLLKSGKVELRSTIDQEKLEEISWDTLQKVDPHRVEPLLGRKCAFCKVRRDSFTIERGNLCQCITKNRHYLRKFRPWQWRSRICEQSQRPSAKQAE